MAKFVGSCVNGADLSNATGLDEACLLFAKYDDHPAPGFSPHKRTEAGDILADTPVALWKRAKR